MYALDSEHSSGWTPAVSILLAMTGGANSKRAETATRVGALGLTENDALNLLFVREARARNQVAACCAAPPSSAGITRETLLNSGCQVLFGGPRPSSSGADRLRRGGPPFNGGPGIQTGKPENGIPLRKNGNEKRPSFHWCTRTESRSRRLTGHPFSVPETRSHFWFKCPGMRAL